MKRLFPVLLAVCFSFPAAASAYGSFLPKAVAEEEVQVYEYLYWDNFTMPMSVSQCRRHNATHVSCLARWELDGYIIFAQVARGGVQRPRCLSRPASSSLDQCV